jgi:tripartite-type tricarboxylate transporter receptor subunit TctC
MRTRTLIAALLALAAGHVSAQSYPSKPLRFITVSAPGNDLHTRVYAQQISSQVGQPVAVENRPGGSGLVGATAGANAAPDGYSVLFATSGTMIFNNFILAKMPFDTLKDFAPVALVSSDPSVLVVSAEHTKIASVQELLDEARRNPNKVSYGHFGPGSLPNILMAVIGHAHGVSFVPVAYKGGPDVYADLLSGRLTAIVDPVRNATPHIKAGKLRALGLTMKAKPLPDVPTLRELGLVNFDSRTWWGVWTPAGVPKENLQRLVSEFDKASQAPDVVAKLEASGAEVGGPTGEKFGAFVAEEMARWRKLIAPLGIKPE